MQKCGSLDFTQEKVICFCILHESLLLIGFKWKVKERCGGFVCSEIWLLWRCFLVYLQTRMRKTEIFFSNFRSTTGSVCQSKQQFSRSSLSHRSAFLFNREKELQRIWESNLQPLLRWRSLHSVSDPAVFHTKHFVWLIYVSARAKWRPSKITQPKTDVLW